MKLREKLDMFSRVAMQEAMDKYAGIMQEIENEYAAAVEEAERQARKKAEITLRTEKYKAEQDMHKQQLVAATEQKKKLTERRNQLLEQLFAEVRSRLIAFTNSPEYKDYLLEQIKLRAAGYANFEIKLRRADMKYADVIKKTAGANVTEDINDFLGGFKLILTDKRAVIDATFESRLKTCQRNFTLLKG